MQLQPAPRRSKTPRRRTNSKARSANSSAATCRICAARTTEASEQAVTNINSLLDRVSGSSVTEIDRLIADLRSVRDFLHSEGERVQREIQSYAQLSTVAMTSVKIIAESMGQWKSQVSDARLDRA